jgi:hypothetical protein
VKKHQPWGKDIVIIKVYDLDAVLLFDRAVIEEVAREEAEKIASTLFPGYKVQWCTPSGKTLGQVTAAPAPQHKLPVCPFCGQLLVTMRDEVGAKCAMCFSWIHG